MVLKMAVIETWYNQDLQNPVKVHYLNGNLFSHNGNGNRIGVHVFDNGEPVTLAGTVSGYVVTSDGSTVPCTGSRSGNNASILVPPAAYQPGAVFITVFLTDGNTVTTLASVSTSVLVARTENQVSPGSVVTDWTQTINAAMQDVETAAENLGHIVATPYASLTFPVPLGKYTYYNNNLYRCISPIASSESFTPAHWSSAINMGDEVSSLKSALLDYNAKNLADDFFAGESGTSRGVTYTFVGKNKCSLTGGATATDFNSFRNIYNNSSDLPDGIVPGETYLIETSGLTNDIYVRFMFYNGGSVILNAVAKKTRELTVPAEATGLVMRIEVEMGTSISGTVAISFAVLENYPNQYIKKLINESTTQVNASMISVGNSILTGAVWTNGSYDHISDYKNSIYGNIAMRLGLMQERIDHTYMDSAGLLYDAGGGSFLTKIKSKSLVNIDYVLTHLYTADMAYDLGDINSAADDGTIAGAVLGLVNYISTRKGKTRLILISVPPVNTLANRKGANVFTGIYPNGSNILDVDNLMYQMAVKYDFDFISWQSMELSYHYNEFTDSNNVHANSEDVYRIMGEYAADSLGVRFTDIKLTETKKELDDWNARNLVADFFAGTDATSRGITFAFGSENSCTVSGTANDPDVNSFRNVYYNETAFPSAIVPGKEYYFYADSPSEYIFMRVLLYNQSGNVFANFKVTQSRFIPIPADAVGFHYRVEITKGTVISNPVIIKFGILTAMPNSAIKTNNKNISNNLPIDYLQKYNFESSSMADIDYDVDPNTGIIHISGTSTALSYAYIFNHEVGFPAGISAGSKVYFEFDLVNVTGAAMLQVGYYEGSTTLAESLILDNNEPVTVPSNATGMMLRIRVGNGETVNAFLKEVHMYSFPSYKFACDKAFPALPLYISIIDDDTKNNYWCRRYYQACMHNGVIGAFACMTKRLEIGAGGTVGEDQSTVGVDPDLLLSYEDAGFSMPTHCYEQTTEYYLNNPGDLEHCREDLAKAKRFMNQTGFCTYNNFIIPYGVKKDAIRDLAMSLDFNSGASLGDDRPNRETDTDRYYIKRYSLNANATGTGASLQQAKSKINSFVREGSGWIIFTTHFCDSWSGEGEKWSEYEWDTTLDDNGYPIGYANFNEFISYAKSKGLTFIPYSVGVKKFLNGVRN
jgi:hypothetical protein